jgi:elongation factor Ts
VATAITADLVKTLRERTGAGMMDCKAALSETNGDIEKAVDALRKRGLASRATSEGVVASYIHMGGKIGVLVEVNCESDFVARTADFQTLVKELGLQIAAAAPLYVSRDEVPADVLEREKAIYREQMAASGKPANVIDKIVEGKLNSYYEQFCLLEQPSIRDPKVKVEDMIKAVIGKLGENIAVARFARFKVGEKA